MQLISMELEAFLPFKDHIFLDFSVVNGDKIFLITGSTGAGKTSVFDAICYALYGEPSGSERDGTKLKSQFADDSAECFVKLCFESKGTRYSIRRTPIQSRLKRSGNITTQQSSAILELESGEIISAKKEVDEKIIEILGINAKQFKKIVMLPQGEFRKFLTDSSTDKQTLLRHIFGTEYFDEFTALLSAEHAQIKEKLDHVKVERDSFTGQIIPLDHELLTAELHSENRDYRKIIELCTELISTQEELSIKLNAKSTSLREQLSALNLPAATSFNKKLSEYLNAKEKLCILKENTAQIDLDKATVSKLFSVREVNLEREQFETASKNSADFEAAVLAKTPLAESAIKNFKDAQAAYDTAFSQQKLTSEKSVTCEKLEQQLSLFSEQKKAQNSLTTAQEKLLEIKHEAKMLALKDELSEKILRSIKVESAANSLLILEKASKAAQSDFLKWQSAYEEFVSGQAYFLSLALHENTPCPVCGSTVHPHPATAKSAAVITKEKLDKLQIKQETSRKSLEKASQDSHECMVALSIEAVDFTTDFLAEMSNSLTLEIKALNEKLADFVTQELSQNALLDLETKLTAEVSGISAKLTELSLKITENNLSEKELTAKIKSIKSEITTSEKALKTSSQLLEKSRDKALRLSSELEKNTVLAKKYAEETLLHNAAYKKLLKKYKLSEDELVILSEKLPQLDSLQKKIEKHTKELATFTQEVSHGKTDFEGKSAIDLVELKEKISAITSEYKATTKEYESAIKCLDGNSKVLKRLKELENEFDSVSENYAQIDMLCRVSSGRYGDKISFERYVLRAYFELVVACASDRLLDMTNGRYSLRRRDIKESGNSSSGLELEVFDAYCGKFRHVNSLSGGEGFKASLCLALGLADVISQKSGGAMLDTIFIDEGFGTLDPAALDNAIECLYSLKNRGRTIGIISHVSELKEKIPVKLSVYQTSAGSTASFN